PGPRLPSGMNCGRVCEGQGETPAPRPMTRAQVGIGNRETTTRRQRIRKTTHPTSGAGPVTCRWCGRQRERGCCQRGAQRERAHLFSASAAGVRGTCLVYTSGLPPRSRLPKGKRTMPIERIALLALLQARNAWSVSGLTVLYDFDIVPLAAALRDLHSCW